MFDPKKIFDMVKNASEMQKNMTEKLKKQQVSGEAAGGMAKIIMNGHFEVEDLKLDPALLSQDKNFIEDIIKASVNDATSQLRATIAGYIKNIGGDLGL